MLQNNIFSMNARGRGHGPIVLAATPPDQRKFFYLFSSEAALLESWATRRFARSSHRRVAC